MLDQNTDRMWYVIGAVLVGAGIILIANGALPQMFASVTDPFEKVSNNAIEGVEAIDGNYFDIKRLVNLGIFGYRAEERTIWKTGKSLTDSGNSQGYGWEVNPGETYVITRENQNTTRFAYAFAKEKPKVGTDLYYVDSRYQDELEMTFTVPEGMTYAFLYITNAAAHRDDRSDFEGIEIRQVAD